VDSPKTCPFGPPYPTTPPPPGKRERRKLNASNNESGRYAKTINLMQLSGIKPRFLVRPVYTLIIRRSELSRNMDRFTWRAEILNLIWLTWQLSEQQGTVTEMISAVSNVPNHIPFVITLLLSIHMSVSSACNVIVNNVNSEWHERWFRFCNHFTSGNNTAWVSFYPFQPFCFSLCTITVRKHITFCHHIRWKQEKNQCNNEPNLIKFSECCTERNIHCLFVIVLIGLEHFALKRLRRPFHICTVPYNRINNASRLCWCMFPDTKFVSL